MKVQRQDHYDSVGTAAPYLLKNIKFSLYNVSNSRSEFLVKLYYIMEQSKGTMLWSALQRRTLPIKSTKQLLKIFQIHIANIQGNCDYILYMNGSLKCYLCNRNKMGFVKIFRWDLTDSILVLA